MKKIRKLTISGFRGIRHTIIFDFTHQHNSILVFGANAKGKSSIGDAVEWFFSGAISELTKEGCTRADYRHRLLGDTEDTVVGFEFSNNALSSNFVLPSSLKQRYSNDTDEFKQYLAASKDELLILRHKDLKQFVDETKSYKRKHIAKLIGMEGWENIRGDMLTVENRLSNELEKQVERKKEREKEVSDLIGVDNFSEQSCWKYAEQQAAALGIDHKIRDIPSLQKADEIGKAKTAATERSATLARLQKAELLFQRLDENPPQTASLTMFADTYNRLCSQPEKVLWLQLSELYKQGKSILRSGQWSGETCPLCGLPISQAEILDHIKEHEDKNQDNQKEIEQLESQRSAAKDELKKVSAFIRSINELELDDITELESLKSSGSEVALALANAEAITEKEPKTLASIDLGELNLNEKITNLLRESKATLAAVRKKQKMLTPTKAEKDRIEAFQNLSNLSTHMEALDRIEAAIHPLKKHVESMQSFTTAFQELRRKTMGDVLETISHDVSRYFLSLHPDEGFDDVQLKFLPEVDGVEFHIYYKGEEITPPRKFLSESYLSGLGVCLFLATVRAFNKENGFVILDDVINSFDAEHRADLARLLVNEFSDLQLIVLTHDGFWFDFFRRLTQSGWQHKRIRDWSYEDGVDIEKSPKSELDDCKQAIKSGNVDYAATQVRKYMENRLKALSYKLGVRMRFRPSSLNEKRMCGELLSEMRRYLKGKDFFKKVDIKRFNELEASTFVVNYGSHDRSAAEAGLVIGDIKFALERLQDLETLFSCSTCKKPVWHFSSRDYAMRCDCGSLSL
jgi:hypothetical protein